MSTATGTHNQFIAHTAKAAASGRSARRTSSANAVIRCV